MPIGYDEVTGVFTTNALSYDTSMPFDEALQIFRDMYADFPFEGEDDLMANRSFAVHVTAHLTAYCRVMLLNDNRPAFVYLANQPGSGKSLLATLALAPVFGAIAIERLTKSEDERQKQITTLMLEKRPYAFYDNVKGFLESESLEQYLTSQRSVGRILGVSKNVEGKNNALVFLTGNTLTMGTDMVRRSLVVELFSAKPVADREFKAALTPTWAVKDGNRKRLLAASFSILKHWEDSGSVRSGDHPLATFEVFSELMGGIVMNAGFVNPLTVAKTGMDETEQAWKLLLSTAAADIADGIHHEFSIVELLDIADGLNVFDILTAGARDVNKAFGHRIKKWKGRVLTDAKGRSFEFGKRDSRVGAAYSVRVYTEAESKAL